MVQEQWLQLKMLILLGYNLEYFIEWGGGGLTFGWEGMKIWWDRKSTGGIFPGWGNFPPSPQ